MPNTATLDDLIRRLEARHAQLTEAIAALREVSEPADAPQPIVVRARRTMSPKARKNMRAGQRRRWAQARKAA